MIPFELRAYLVNDQIELLFVLFSKVFEHENRGLEWFVAQTATVLMFIVFEDFLQTDTSARIRS